LKKALYIGQYSDGTTSKMRADILRDLLSDHDLKIIDTNLPYNRSKRLLRSFTFRYKVGPLVNTINEYIKQNVDERYDLIWVDKGVYIKRETTEKLRKATQLLIHFTPDPAFTFHRSRHFRASISSYDFVVTTKSYEIQEYEKYLSTDKIIQTTQGYDPNLHYPKIDFNEKRPSVLFIGHYESERLGIIRSLLEAGIEVSLAGKAWRKRIKQLTTYMRFQFLGEGIYGEDYSLKISKHQFALGLLSKWIPELHTTRTLEIPACGTALITERNSETIEIFKDEDAIFYNSHQEMVDKVTFYLANPKKLQILTSKGYNRVIRGGYDYRSQLKSILEKVGI
jgi:spore maturation protein CgeB